MSDYNFISVGVTTTTLSIKSCPLRQMLLSSHLGIGKFGRMIGPKDVPTEQFFSLQAHGLAMICGRGLLVLELQERTLRFLNSCASIILNDCVLPHTIHYGPLCDCPLKKQSGEQPLLSWSLTMLEAPYQVPDPYDFARLKNHLNAKRAEAEDQLWAL